MVYPAISREYDGLLENERSYEKKGRFDIDPGL